MHWLFLHMPQMNVALYSDPITITHYPSSSSVGTERYILRVLWHLLSKLMNATRELVDFNKKPCLPCRRAWVNRHTPFTPVVIVIGGGSVNAPGLCLSSCFMSFLCGARENVQKIFSFFRVLVALEFRLLYTKKVHCIFLILTSLHYTNVILILQHVKKQKICCF